MKINLFGPDIALYVDSFINQYKDENYLYEIYINKRRPYDFLITLYAGEVSLSGEENSSYSQIPFYYTEVQGKHIDIYCGVERYLNISFSIPTPDVESMNTSNSKCWAIHYTQEGITVYKNPETYYPFTNSTDQFPEVIFLRE